MNTKNASEFLNKIIQEEETFGGMMKNIRECEEMTQVEFALILGVKPQYLSDIENNRRSISVKSAYLFAEKLGYLPEDFVRLALQDEANRSFCKSGLRVDVTLSFKAIDKILLSKPKLKCNPAPR